MIAAFWLLTIVPVCHIIRPFFGDFHQFYMGGLISATHHWEALYPIPRVESHSNPGSINEADPKPLHNQLARSRGIDGVGFNFIQLPPVAFLLTPMSWLEPAEAHWIWLMMLIASGVLISLQAGWLAERCFAQPTRIAGIVTLIAAMSQTMFRAIRCVNTTALIGALIGWTILDLIRGSSIGSAIAIVLASVLKYIGAAFVPIALLMRRCKTLLLSAILTAALFGVTLAISGPAVFKEFFKQIAPRLGRSTPILANQSVEGFLVRVTHQFPLDRRLHIALLLTQWLTFVVLLAILARHANKLRRSPQAVCAACAMLLSWMMLFSPICWDNYLVYLMPLWGWLAWEATQGKARLILALLAIALAAVNTAGHPRFGMPEPFNSHVMFAMMLTLALGVARIRSRDPTVQ